MIDDKKTTFGYYDQTFINIYNRENPILEENDITYFLFFSIDNYHRPILGKGKIISDIFTDGMNKIYYIQLLEIIENLGNQDKYVWNQNFLMLQYDSFLNKIQTKKTILFNPNLKESFFQENLFKIEAFFVRQTIEQIKDLQKYYVKIILDDLIKHIADINSILEDS